MNKRDDKILVIVICIALFFSLIGFVLALKNNNKEKDNNITVEARSEDDTLIVVDSFGRYSIEVINRVGQFSVLNISSKVNQIKGVSWREGAPVDLDDLALVEVTYYGFDGEPHLGELVVHKSIAQEVAAIFQDLYEARFPIEKIRLVDEYEASDDLSMEDNNTSAFNYRVVEGSTSLSKHSYGIAIDINPVQNPYVKKNIVSPEKGKEYLNREDVRKGMIIKGDPCYKAFTSRGWTWGGEWKTLKDYQHFEKNIPLE